MKTTKLSILVIDDNENNRASAKQLLEENHNLTVVGTHDEALDMLVSPRLPDADAYWDVVMSDLLLPASKRAQGKKGKEYIGQEMPIGWSIAIEAALSGAKYVAVVTNTNHHNHPASAMLDSFSKKVFEINGVKALFTNRVGIVGIVGSEREGKDWDSVLKSLIGGSFQNPPCW